ncbi:MAG TPA: hypothetical protein PK539_01495 [Candidatus Paceibacterota bacterium]|nr:hypothetical protein [Candidatus Paceibacterota bacterium]
MKWRIAYAVLWILALGAYFMPWSIWSTWGATPGHFVVWKVMSGWNYLVPFSFPYLLGLIVGFVALFTRHSTIKLTAAAGILMLLGVLGGFWGIISLAVPIAPGPHAAIGLVLAFISSIAYPILSAAATGWFGNTAAAGDAGSGTHPPH